MDNKKVFEELRKEVDDFFKSHGLEEKFEALFSDEEIQSEIRSAYDGAIKEMDDIAQDAPEDLKELINTKRREFDSYSIEDFTSHVKMIAKTNLIKGIRAFKDYMPDSIADDERFNELIGKAMEELLSKPVMKDSLVDTISNMGNNMVDFFIHELTGAVLVETMPDGLKELIDALSDTGVEVAVGIAIPFPFDDDDEEDDGGDSKEKPEE